MTESLIRPDRPVPDGHTPPHENWWKNAVAYHIYPRSFQDSNGDGIGDLAGITSRLDYLADLGVDLIMLSPVYSTPDDDNGYDISNYCDIDPKFGTMEDFDALRDGVHSRGMRLMMDLVLNHTSDEHPWFEQSRKSITNPYRDFYHWQRGKDGTPPNNWQSVFSGSAWELDAATGEYYLHLYSKKQPDLNWDNPKVRQHLFEVVRFWIDKGVDGFRLDTITTISKVKGYPDAETTTAGAFQPAHELIFNGPEIHQYLSELKQSAFAGQDVVVVGEGPGVSTDQARLYLDPESGSMDMIFQWEHIESDPGSGGKWNEETWTPKHFKTVMTRWQNALSGHGWNTLYLSNHDQPRQVSRFGDDGRYWKESATALATALYFLQGTPFIFQGEEVGMTNANFPQIDDYRDLESLNYYAESIALDQKPAEVFQRIQDKSRDNGRTPMQWSSGAQAGFTTGAPWIAVNANAGTVNVEQQRDDPNSIFSFYRHLIRVRKSLPVVSSGNYQELEEVDSVYGYVRTNESDELLVLTNLSAETQPILTSQAPGATLVLSNYADAATATTHLRPFESRVFLRGCS